MTHNPTGAGKIQNWPIAKTAMLAAISVVLVWLFHFPIFPAAPFLEYDPANIPILIGAFAYGPLAGILLTLATSLLQGLTVSAHSGVYGILMHILSTGTLVLAAGLCYRRCRTKPAALRGLFLGIAALVPVMLGANLLVTPLFMGVSREVVWSLMPVILGFNLLKAGINSAVTFLLYQRISPLLHK